MGLQPRHLPVRYHGGRHELIVLIRKFLQVSATLNFIP
jgi:hypothetical protein